MSPPGVGSPFSKSLFKNKRPVTRPGSLNRGDYNTSLSLGWTIEKIILRVNKKGPQYPRHCSYKKRGFFQEEGPKRLRIQVIFPKDVNLNPLTRLTGQATLTPVFLKSHHKDQGFNLNHLSIIVTFFSWQPFMIDITGIKGLNHSHIFSGTFVPFSSWHGFLRIWKLFLIAPYEPTHVQRTPKPNLN